MSLFYFFFLLIFLGTKPPVVAADPVYVKPKFTILDPAGRITASGDGYVATRSGGKGWQYALLTPQISAHSPPSYVKIKINKLTYSHYIFLGVIGNSSPSVNSYSDPTFYGYQYGKAYAAGFNTFPMESYGQFETGDIVVFQLDMTAHTLKMTITRLGGRVSTITGLKVIPAYWFYVYTYCGDDQVEVLDVTPSDTKLF